LTEWRIPLFKIYNDQSDVDVVTKVIMQGRDWALGSEIKEFEKGVADYIGVKYAVAVNSGTSALHTVLLAHGIGKGDEVIVPSFTFIATVNSVLMVGATPVFADIEEKTYGLDTVDISQRVTRKTKAIIAVHYGGASCQIDKLRLFADIHSLILIEDNAPSFGATNKGRKLGSIGDSAILSFCSAKIITCGEGGMVLTNNRDIYEKAKLTISHGRAESDYFNTSEVMEYITLGYNFRMSTMSAALGLSQLKKVEHIISMRQERACYLTIRLASIPNIITPIVSTENVYMLYTIRLKDKPTRDGLKTHLEKNNILSRVYFNPVHLSKFYKSMEYKNVLPITEKCADTVLSLPMYPDLSHEDIDYMVEKIRGFLT
jgi:perosamine synthetase